MLCSYLLGKKIKGCKENHKTSTEAVVHLMDQLGLEASSEGMDEPISADEMGEAVKNYGGPALRKGVRGPNYHICIFFFLFNIIICSM